MRALADALAAEMGNAPRRTEPDGTMTQGKR
jgi:hypothetical protein